jgi:hypothetical protein
LFLSYYVAIKFFFTYFTSLILLILEIIGTETLTPNKTLGLLPCPVLLISNSYLEVI